MKISVFGATGMAGSAIVAEALERQHHVVALARNPATDADHELLDTQSLDVADTAALDPVLAESDATVLTVRLPAGEETRLAPLTRGFLDAAQPHGTRVLIVGGAAPLRSPQHPDLLVLDDPGHVPDAWRTIARASLDQFRVCLEHPYTGWVYLSPPAVLEPGERGGRYRRGTNTLLTDENGTSRITAPDLAIGVLDELERPSDEQHFTVAEDTGS